MSGLPEKIALYLRMIKIAHSIFALPFAFTAAILAATGLPSLNQIFWITVAMVGARSGAMGLNRIIDRRIDAVNPRTCAREIPAGKINVRDAVLFTAVSLCFMVFAAYQLNTICFVLSPIAIAVLVAYSYTKRFTWASHVVPLVLAVIFWLAGFDILYALQDIDFDKQHGLHSIPERFGIKTSLILSRMFHAITFGLLILTGLIFSLDYFYWLGLLIVLVLLIYEHSLVRTTDLSRLNMAFFNMNGYISLTIFIFTFLAVTIR
jgi:4-hydroxybenzoate polyprenyltransferase